MGQRYITMEDQEVGTGNRYQGRRVIRILLREAS